MHENKPRDKKIIGIDLAATPKKPTGWALWNKKTVSVCHVYGDDDILASIQNHTPILVAIDAPLSLPRGRGMRNADKTMHRMGYPVLPPLFPAMKQLTLRAITLAQHIQRSGFTTIEIHPTSTRKALQIPAKDWGVIQAILVQMGLKGDLKKRTLTPHELDAATAALTAHLHLRGKTQLIGDTEEGYIVVPQKSSWTRLKL